VWYTGNWTLPHARGVEPRKRRHAMFKKEEKILEKNEENFFCKSNSLYYDGKILSYIVPKTFYSMELFDSSPLYVKNSNFPDKKIFTIFKDKGEKKYFTFNVPKYFYYSNRPSILLTEKNFWVNDYFSRKNAEDIFLFEEDIKKNLKFSIDFHFIREKAKIESQRNPLKIFFCDIEVFNERDVSFPFPEEAAKKINAISYYFEGEKKILLLGGKIKSNFVETFSSEKELLEAFLNIIQEKNPDIITGWNFIGFDMLYLLNRMKKIGIDYEKFSPLWGNKEYKQYKKVFWDNEKKSVYVLGLVVLDMLDLYKKFNQNAEETYKLDFIAQKQLGIGKIEYETSLDELYLNDLNKFIEYSSRDVELIYKLEEKLSYISLLDDLRFICRSTWDQCLNTTGLVDPLVLSAVKKMGKACPNRKDNFSCSIQGAYVKTPVPGRFDYVIDLDFTSLYPSIIRTFNIGPNTYIAKVDERDAKEIIFNKNISPDYEFDIHLNPLISSEVKRYTYSKFKEVMEKNNLIISTNGCIFKTVEKSIFSNILEDLMEKRKYYKDLMKKAKGEGDEINMRKYNNIQLSYKILANSIYGVLACPFFRFFDKDLAESITVTGQHLIKFCGYHLEKYMKNGDKNLETSFFDRYEEIDFEYVIYQDTDSIFVNMGKYLKKKETEV